MLGAMTIHETGGGESINRSLAKKNKKRMSIKK